MRAQKQTATPRKAQPTPRKSHWQSQAGSRPAPSVESSAMLCTALHMAVDLAVVLVVGLPLPLLLARHAGAKP